MKSRFMLVGLALALSIGVSHATPISQTQYCPFEGIGGDLDRVTLAGPTSSAYGVASYNVTVDESVGEASHVVTGAFIAQSSDGGSTAYAVVVPGFSPQSATLGLTEGHQYSVQWVTDFDFGVHPCSSSEPGETPFTVNA
ncbi:MAG: hypothetical protein ACYDCC_00820 [Actinomycetota bacterium]